MSESVQWKAHWAQQQSSPGACFGQFSTLLEGQAKQWNHAGSSKYQTVLTPVDPGNVLLLGPPCKDLTRKNNAHKAKSSCVSEGTGASGSAMHAVRDFLKIHAPLIVLLEQVKGCMVRYNSQPSNYDQIVEILESAGYMVRTPELNSSLWVPQHRARLYFTAIHIEKYSNAMPGENLLERMDEYMTLCNEMSASQGLPAERALTLDDFIMPLEHPSCQSAYEQVVRKASKIDAAIAADPCAFRAGRGKKRHLADDSDDEGDVIADSSSPTPWPEIHQREYERAGLEYKPCTQNEFSILYQNNAFYRSLPPRCRECVLFFDQTRPMTEIDAERYPSIDLHDP